MINTLLSTLSLLTYVKAEIAECRAFTNVFLMTFRTFTTANRLFEMLLDRFHVKPPKSLTESERKEWKLYLRLPVQQRVLEVFGIWLEENRMLEEEPHVSQRLADFLGTINSPTLLTTATAITRTVERLVSRAVVF